MIAVAYGKVTSAKQVLASDATVTKAQGNVTYANAGTNTTAKELVAAAKTGKVTVLLPKGAKKGAYAVVFEVTAAVGNKSYISGAKTVEFAIRVK